jgi:hypothetical protein
MGAIAAGISATAARISPSFSVVTATKANPVKAGDAKLRGYSAPKGIAKPVEPPNSNSLRFE